ncbi:MAG: hypothetical protein WBC17_03230 [Mycobacterium sp.]|jgi:hypothetical protein
MKRSRQFLALLAGGIGTAAALLGAPIAAADEYGGGGANNPLLPGCETTGGSAVIGGQTTDCASPGNSQITATPNDLGSIASEADEGWGGYGFGGW